MECLRSPFRKGYAAMHFFACVSVCLFRFFFTGRAFIRLCGPSPLSYPFLPGLSSNSIAHHITSENENKEDMILKKWLVEKWSQMLPPIQRLGSLNP